MAQGLDVVDLSRVVEVMLDHHRDDPARLLQLETVLWECESGHELRAIGLGEDVRLNVYDTVLVLRGERLELFVQSFLS